ncbi:TonB-dependent receptor [Sphingomonas sp.]|uniref:TonB-dependent receptor n=1 Tax=Sphingomonas sp. TaxID=28214 RepID=UPI0025CC2DDC|nr:TonB-dependent receptor [Sphingomonas sp.]
MRVFLLASTAVVASTGFTNSAFAQVAGQAAASTAEATDSTADASDTKVVDIIVTATRRSQSLQDVPASIQAVSATQLKAFKIDGVLQLPNLVPGLVVAPSGGNNIYLRGIGSSSTGYNEGQTAVYIDGLYLPNPAMSIYSFNNIERIEVLKGPQGTLYGRNVTAGLISVTTRDPGDAVKVDASLGYGNFDTVTANFYGSTPLSDTFAVNTAVFYQKQGKGWSRNIFTGNDAQKSEEFGVQAKFVWKPGVDTRVTGSFIYDWNNRTFGAARQVYPGTLGSDGTPYLGEYRVTGRFDQTAPFHANIASLKIEQDLGFARLMSLTGYQSSALNILFDGSPILGQPLPGQSSTPTYFAQSNRTWSQEFQLTSSAKAARFQWIVGAFYYNDITRLELNSSQTCVGTVCAPGTPNRNFGRPTTESYSAYGDVSYRFLNATKLTVGLRYTDETKGLTGLLSPLAGFPNSVTAIPVPPSTPAGNPQPTVVALTPGQPYTLAVGGVTTLFPGIPTRLHFGKLTYRFVLSQEIGKNIRLYASHDLGFKSGAYNGNSFTNPPVNPELLYATEVGLKSQLFDNRLRFNIAYFHYTYKDVQVRTQAPPAVPGFPILLNVARERIDGVDADFALVLIRGLTIQGAFEVLNAKFADYPGATCIVPGTRVVGGVTIGAPVSRTCNFAGNRVAYAPPFSGSIGVTYKLETPTRGDFTFNVNDRYNSPYPLSGDNYMIQQSHHLVDASIGWVAPAGHFDAQLFVRNLTNQYVYATGLVSNSFQVTPGAPRTYGATIGYHF